MSKLKACPHCGKTHAARLMTAREVYRDSALEGVTVLCVTGLGGCGASSGYRQTELLAKSAWNYRQNEKPSRSASDDALLEHARKIQRDPRLREMLRG